MSSRSPGIVVGNGPVSYQRNREGSYSNHSSDSSNLSWTCSARRAAEAIPMAASFSGRTHTEEGSVASEASSCVVDTGDRVEALVTSDPAAILGSTSPCPLGLRKSSIQ